jgi:hypothetical protein
MVRVPPEALALFGTGAPTAVLVTVGVGLLFLCTPSEELRAT